MNDKVSVPIFKPRRASFSTSPRNDQNPPNSQNGTKPLEYLPSKAKLKLVQLEIAEKEACSLLKTLCSEGTKMIGNYDTEVEVPDLLSGILLLGNINKRIGASKQAIEESLEKVRKDFNDIDKSRKLMIDQLEGVIMKLRNENIKANDTVAEMKLKHDQKIMMTMKEITQSQEQLNEIRKENERLVSNQRYLERKVMEIPRLEEQYLRSAREIVRQKEQTNTTKEVGWKKLEEDVKNLSYWKNKANSLEDTVMKQKTEIESLSNQARLCLSKYQTLLATYNQEKKQQQIQLKNSNRATMMMMNNRPGSAPLKRGMSSGKLLRSDSTMGRLMRGDSSNTGFNNNNSPGTIGFGMSRKSLNKYMDAVNGYSSGNINNMMMSSPSPTKSDRGGGSNNNDNYSYAPSVNTSHQNTVNFNDTNNNDNNNGDNNTTSQNASTTNTIVKLGQTRIRPQSAPTYQQQQSTKKQPERERTTEEMHIHEILKLQDQNKHKDEHIAKLAQKLSHARAYPLLSVDYEKDEDDDHITKFNTTANTTMNNNIDDGTISRRMSTSMSPTHSGNNNKHNRKISTAVVQFCNELDRKLEEEMNMSETSEYYREEQQLETNRIENTKRIQTEFSNRILRVKSASSGGSGSGGSSSNAPHIAAIRNSRKFGKSSNDETD